MKQKRAYQYRCSPTNEQEQVLARTFGCVRFVYNWALRKKTDAYYQQGERLYYAHLSSALTEMKRQEEVAWLNDVASVPLQQSLRHLDRAFLNFFEGRAQYPTFKTKRGYQSATYVGTAFRWDGTSLTLAKMDAPLDIRWSRPLPDSCNPTTVTISKDGAGRYFVSLLVEEDIAPLPVTPKMVGLDLGLKSMVITSDGHTYGNPRFFAKDERNWRRHNVDTPGNAKAPRTGTRPGRRLPEYTLALPRGGVITNTNSRPRSYARTRSYASRVCPSRTWCTTTASPSPSLMWGGASSCGSWNTKRCGTGVLSSRLTNGTPPPNAALTVGMCSKPFRWMFVSGRALNARSSMIVISMPQTTFWRRDSPCLPVERR